MVDDSTDHRRPLRRPAASAAVSGLGWRYVLGVYRAAAPVPSMADAVDAAARAVAAAGRDADGHLWLDLRPDRVLLTVQTLAIAAVTEVDVRVVERISAALYDLGRPAGADVDDAAPRSVQVLEIAIDALDIAAVRPFWRAVLGYGDEPGRTGPQDPVVDPLGQGPAVWFQQMDAPRPQRNRIHLDVSVPHDEVPRRIAAALAAGGTLVSDARAPAFWVLADREGNEACVTTWQGRDM